jgi:hypothetical protein
MNPYLIGAGVGLQSIGTGINLYNSYSYLDEAKNQLRDLENNPIEPYKASSQTNTAYASARAGMAAPKGMSMEDVNRFYINQARNENTALANANKMGGGRGTLSVLNAGLTGLDATMAGKSAEIAVNNKNIDTSRATSLSQTYQNLSNMNAKANWDAQTYLGQAIKQQRQNIAGAWGSFANMGGMMAGYGMFGGGGGTSGVDKTVTPSTNSSIPYSYQHMMPAFQFSGEPSVDYNEYPNQD